MNKPKMRSCAAFCLLVCLPLVSHFFHTLGPEDSVSLHSPKTRRSTLVNLTDLIPSMEKRLKPKELLQEKNLESPRLDKRLKKFLLVVSKRT